MKDNNLNWIRSVKKQKRIYEYVKKYITTRDINSLYERFGFLEISTLYGVIIPDEKLMKPYLKCYIYESQDEFIMLIHIKVTGLETKAEVLYCKKNLDNDDVNQIKLFFEGNTTKRTISLKLRSEILRRDDYKCVHCGRRSDDGVKLHIDHILPFSKGGLTVKENLQTLCNECNIGKSNRHNK